MKEDAMGNNFFSLFTAIVILCLDQDLARTTFWAVRLFTPAWQSGSPALEGLIVYPALKYLGKHLLFFLLERKYKPISIGLGFIFVIFLF